MQQEIYKYSHGDLPCEGLIVRKPNLILPAPVVVICHHWNGRDALMESNAERIAQMGYISLAADIYGQHQTATDRERCAALMNPFVEDRVLLRERLRATISAAQRIPGADGKRIVVIGFCFGGLCALDAARACLSGVVGVASFHGLLNPPNIGKQISITAKVLVLHGYEDPMANPDSLTAFKNEMTAANAQWEVDAYGKTVHAFTNPNAQDRAAGMEFDATICNRAFSRLESFLSECFAR